MKKLIYLIVLLLAGINMSAQSFVNPINFVNNEANKKKVIAYIKKEVKETYSKINMDDPSTLRMMEKDRLEAFKKLTKVTNKTLLRQVIKTYCDIGMCDYSTILMMYEEQNRASKEELEW